MPEVVNPDDAMPVWPPTPGPTLSPEAIQCQKDCGDTYYTCAVMECEGQGQSQNTTEVKDIITTDSGVTENDTDNCWLHCRKSFTTCFDLCKLLCKGENCPTTTTNSEYKFDWNTVT